MNPKTYLTVTLLAGACALPASASAATTSVSVRADVHASTQAFEKAKTLTQADRDGAAVAQLRLGMHELRSAARTTARMRRSAHGSRAVTRVVRAERLVGRGADAGAGALASVVSDADVSVDVDMATALSSLLTIHQQVIDALTATIGVASDAVDAIAVQAIAELTEAVAGVVGAISGVLGSADVSVDATAELGTALQLATATLTSSLAILQTLPGAVSEAGQGLVGTAIGTVTGALVQAQATLQTLVSTVTGLGTGAVSGIVLPTLGSLLGAVNLALSAGANAHIAVSAGATAG